MGLEIRLSAALKTKSRKTLPARDYLQARQFELIIIKFASKKSGGNYGTRSILPGFSRRFCLKKKRESAGLGRYFMKMAS